jgi:homoserine O-acetyltransferase
VPANAPLALELGGSIGPINVEYETYGSLSPDKDNVVFIAHALSGDAHVAGWDRRAAETGRTWRQKKPGWWDAIVGPGKAIDTDRLFVICPNVLGGCYGTTGPSSVDLSTGKPYGLRFPMVTVGDWVNLHMRLLDALGIARVKAVVGGSLGGQQALEMALAHPHRVERSVVLAASARLSVQGLAFNAVGRYCILHDPNFAGGDYYDSEGPSAGLAAARMLAHITYLSDEGMHEKFGRRLQDGGNGRQGGFGIEFAVESYLDHQGRAFVERFDANSYLYVTRAMDYYDAAAAWGGQPERGLPPHPRQDADRLVRLGLALSPRGLQGTGPGPHPGQPARHLRQRAVALRPRFVPGGDREGRTPPAWLSRSLIRGSHDATATTPHRPRPGHRPQRGSSAAGSF